MKKEEAEHLLEGYLKPILGFTLKRCKSSEDAEDLSQEIILKAYRAMLTRDDVEDAGKFIWTVAHNALCNYYRSAPENMIGIPAEELAEFLAGPEAEDEIRTAVYFFRGWPVPASLPVGTDPERQAETAG